MRKFIKQPRQKISASKEEGKQRLRNLVDMALREVRSGKSVDAVLKKMCKAHGFDKDGDTYKFLERRLKEDTAVQSSKAVNKSYIKADAAEDMRQKYRDRRAAAHQKKVDFEQGEANKLIPEIEAVKNIQDRDEAIETLFDLLVPGSGPSKYYGGELIRAMMRLLYRDSNDGDVFYEGYGIETCADAAAFLCAELPYLESEFEDIAMRHLKDDAYTEELYRIAESVVNEVVSDPEEAVTKNTHDYQDEDGEKFIRENEWEPTYDYDAMIPDNVQFHLDRGDISERDLIWELESWDGLQDTNIDISGDEVYVDGLTLDQYEQIDGNLYKWLEEYGNSLDDEYGSEEDEEYDEEHEYDEEEE